jgi:hypothetical protein
MVFRREPMIQEILAITLIASSLGLLGWALVSSYWGFAVLPIALGELITGLYLYLLRSEGGKRG